jgi:hypothetical protein
MMEDKDEKMGDKKFKAGLDNITTGLFQWSKDYASAASNFTEAGKKINIQSIAISRLKSMIKL